MPNKKDKKKYARQEAIRQRKHVVRTERDRQRQEANREYHLTQLFRNRKRPIRRTEGDELADQMTRDQQIRDQLERNMEILKALESEMEQEEEARRRANEYLESNGAETLQEKLESLQRMAEESVDAGVGGGADVQFNPRTEN